MLIVNGYLFVASNDLTIWRTQYSTAKDRNLTTAHRVSCTATSCGLDMDSSTFFTLEYGYENVR